MENHPERRSCRRVVVGPDHSIRFSLKGHEFRGVRITNISLTGCFAMVGQGDAALFSRGTFLEGFAFEHPALAGSPFTAEVMYTLGGEEPVLEFAGVGIQFVDMDETSADRLSAFLESCLD